MKLYNILFLSVFLPGLAVSCDSKEQIKKETTEKVLRKQKLQKIAIVIEGMTCQIGCAKTIESKLSKMEGVSSALVTFDKKLGEIVFDTNQISKDDISKKIKDIAGGNIYSIISIEEVEL